VLELGLGVHLHPQQHHRLIGGSGSYRYVPEGGADQRNLQAVHAVGCSYLSHCILALATCKIVMAKQMHLYCFCLFMFL